MDEHTITDHMYMQNFDKLIIHLAFVIVYDPILRLRFPAMVLFGVWILN